MDANDYTGKPGETVQPGQDGDAAELDKGKTTDGQPDADGGEDAEDLKGKLAPEVQEKVNRRIGKVTAKQKAAEARAAAAEEELARIKAEREEAEAAKFGHLPVMPEYLTPEDRKGIAEAEGEFAEAEESEKAWTKFAESDEGYTDRKTGRTYTPAQCAAFAKQAAREAGRAEAKKDLYVAVARKRQEADLRELRAKRAAPKAGAGAPELPETPKKSLTPRGDEGGGGSAPARPADIQRTATPPKVPQAQNDAKKFWKRF